MQVCYFTCSYVHYGLLGFRKFKNENLDVGRLINAVFVPVCVCTRKTTKTYYIAEIANARARARLNAVVGTLRAWWGVRSPRRQTELPQLFVGWVNCNARKYIRLVLCAFQFHHYRNFENRPCTTCFRVR